MNTAMEIEANGLTEVMIRLEEMPGAIRRSIAAAVYGQAVRVQKIVKEDKLQGGVLNKRTGRLRDSIHIETDNTAGAVVARVGTDVEYAAYHEYGFSGTEQVREHLRTITEAFGRPLETPRDVLVRAHSRNVEYPAHSFLRSTLEEEAPTILAAFQAAVEQALNA